MRKSMLSLALVVPLAALISPPAVAHNDMCCVPDAPAPQPNPPTPPQCQSLFTAPIDAFCKMSRTPTDFCDDFLLPTNKLFYTRWDYTNVNGKCMLTGSDRRVRIGTFGPQVKQCPTGGSVTICP
jgi:hypothetical protein